VYIILIIIRYELNKEAYVTSAINGYLKAISKAKSGPEALPSSQKSKVKI
jgi:hypothetical protein